MARDRDDKMLVIAPEAGGARVSLREPPVLEPGPGDSRAMMAWWNNLPPDERSDWMEAAGSTRPADAYAAYLRWRGSRGT